MSASQKQKIIVAINDVHLDLNGSLDSVIATLQRLKETYEESGFSDLFIDTDYGYGGASNEMVLRGTRLETDAEAAARVQQEQRRREAAEERERAEYERLSKKFGK